MRTLAKLVCLVTVLALSSCVWEGQGAGVTEEQKKLGIRDVSALAAEYETQSYYRNVRQTGNGRASAFGRGLQNITRTIDRHFFNYSRTDPYLDHDSDLDYGDHLIRFGVSTIAR